MTRRQLIKAALVTPFAAMAAPQATRASFGGVTLEVLAPTGGWVCIAEIKKIDLALWTKAAADERAEARAVLVRTVKPGDVRVTMTKERT